MACARKKKEHLAEATQLKPKGKTKDTAEENDDTDLVVAPSGPVVALSGPVVALSGPVVALSWP